MAALKPASGVTEKAAKPAKAPKLAKPKLTAAERKAVREREQAEALARQKAALAAYEVNRPALWLALWAKAMRLALIIEEKEDFVAEHSWWFDDFGVDAEGQSFRLETNGGNWVSEAKLYASDVDRFNEALDTALEWLAEFRAEQERKRQVELERQQKRAAALNKLTDEDKRLLGVR